MEDNNQALQRLNENCLLIKISTGLPGQTYTSKDASADASMANNANVDRLKTQVLKFTKVRDDAKQLLAAVSIPWDSNGKRLIQVETYQNIKQRLSDYRAEFYDKRDEFVDKYHSKVQRAANELPDVRE